LIGRNFDFEAGRHFDENKIVGLYRPEKGRAFISVCWPGMAGAVTGINEDLIYCSINGAHSEDRKNIGRPVSLVVRQVLQYAGNLQEAESIVREAPVFVSDSYLLADGKSAEAIVVEKSPKKVDVRRMAGDLILQANHFECPAFAADAGNLEYMREGSSVLKARAPRGDRSAATRAASIRRPSSRSSATVRARGTRILRPKSGRHQSDDRHAFRGRGSDGGGTLGFTRPSSARRFEAFSIGTFDKPAAPPLDEDPRSPAVCTRGCAGLVSSSARRRGSSVCAAASVRPHWLGSGRRRISIRAIPIRTTSWAESWRRTDRRPRRWDNTGGRWPAAPRSPSRRT